MEWTGPKSECGHSGFQYNNPPVYAGAKVSNSTHHYEATQSYNQGDSACSSIGTGANIDNELDNRASFCKNLIE